MDWHKLEKIPFGIRECRHRGREAETSREQGRLGLAAGGLAPFPAPTHMQIPHKHSLCVCVGACVRVCMHVHTYMCICQT